MAEATVNIGANTGQATAAVENLNSALGQTGAAATNASNRAEELSKSLERQEAQIKVIDGAINLLGGSVELAAGAFVGLGLASEEQAGQFEAAALGAIAFADGAKRTLDGVKSLNEGLKAFGGVAGLARKAQAALNATILANPYVLAAAAVVALAAALVVFATRETEAEKASAKALETSKLRLKNLEDSESRVLAFARAQGLAAETTLQFEEASIKARIAEIDRALSLEKDSKEFARLSEEQNKLLDKEIEVGLALGKIREDNRQALIKESQEKKKEAAEASKAATEKAQKEAEAAQKATEKLKEENDKKFQAEQDYFDKVNDLLQTEEESRILAVAKQYDDLIEQAAQFNADTTALEEARAQAIQKVIDDTAAEKQAKADEDSKKTRERIQADADALLNAQLTLLDNSAVAFGALANLFEEGTLAFKTAALAEIAISTATGFINALDIAQKSAKATGPAAAFAFPIFYASQIAAVLGAVASAKQVLSTTPGGGGGSNVPRPSIQGTPSIGNAGFTGALPGTEGAGPAFGFSLGQQPVRAYVVAQDVSNGQEAVAAINRRRRLGPG